ncbi:MAG: penicillin acylase family protein [Deltaproteobacteria bacterium]|nr:penicillin acylase family protein [Nannocystaceae bacterium]
MNDSMLTRNVASLSCALLFLAACSDGEGPVDLGPLDEFPGLSAPAEIIVDTQGIPHVYARTDLDVMHAAGYQMATDRLFQMDLVRRRALGRQAEVLGAKAVAQDEVSRLFDFRRWGAANTERVREEDPDRYRLLVAWVSGVNRRIEEVVAGEAPLPYGFGPAELDYTPETWSVEEHGAIAKMLFFGNSNSLERELLATILQRNFAEAWELLELARPAFPTATMPEEERPPAVDVRREALPPARVERIDATPAEIAEAVRELRRALGHLPRTGSNNWAIAGEHTDTGRPYIAGDPHQALQSPSLMYAQHLDSASADGTLNVAGWSFAGAAGIHLGHNRHLQWTATTNFADVMDIWEVPTSTDTAQLGGQSLDVVERVEEIMVAGEQPRSYVVRDVPDQGVLLPADLLPIPVASTGNELLLRWTGFAATSEERCFFAMAVAEDVDDYDEAVALMQVGGFNFVAADSRAITYRVAIDVPDRGLPAARPMPYTVIDGTDPSTLWSEMLPLARLPHSRGGARGFISTANNDPWGFTFDGDVSNDPWYYGYFYASGDRAHRLDSELARLTAAGTVTRAQMEALQTDTHSSMSDLLLPVLQAAWDAAAGDDSLAEFAADAELATLVDLLTQDWDRRMERDSAGALAFHIWMMWLTQDAVGDELSLLLPTILEEETPFAIKFPVLAVTGAYPRSDELLQGGRERVVLGALAKTAETLRARFGAVDPAGYSWGDLHGTRFDNPYGGALAGGWTPTDGGEDTVNVSSSLFFAGTNVAERFDSTQGAIFRVVTGFDDDGTPEVWANFPRGNSGDPTSAHFDDTLEDWAEDRYRPLPFARADVDAAAESSRILEP